MDILEAAGKSQIRTNELTGKPEELVKVPQSKAYVPPLGKYIELKRGLTDLIMSKQTGYRITESGELHTEPVTLGYRIREDILSFFGLRFACELGGSELSIESPEHEIIGDRSFVKVTAEWGHYPEGQIHTAFERRDPDKQTAEIIFAQGEIYCLESISARDILGRGKGLTAANSDLREVASSFAQYARAWGPVPVQLSQFR